MRVYLVRHGEAKAADEDAERPLSDAGRDAVARLAAWSAREGVRPREIRHSGVLRAQQTAEILADALAPAGGVRAVRGISPDDDPDACAADLALGDGDVLLVTHMPFVSGLAGALLGRTSGLPFRTAEMACLERADGAWTLRWTAGP